MFWCFVCAYLGMQHISHIDFDALFHFNFAREERKAHRFWTTWGWKRTEFSFLDTLMSFWVSFTVLVNSSARDVGLKYSITNNQSVSANETIMLLFHGIHVLQERDSETSSPSVLRVPRLITTLFVIRWCCASVAAFLHVLLSRSHFTTLNDCFNYFFTSRSCVKTHHWLQC